MIEKPLTVPEARRRIARIQEGLGPDRSGFPDFLKGSVARGLWNDERFAYGMEYGYLLAMLDVVEGTDSTLQGKEGE